MCLEMPCSAQDEPLLRVSLASLDHLKHHTPDHCRSNPVGHGGDRVSGDQSFRTSPSEHHTTIVSTKDDLNAKGGRVLTFPTAVELR